MWKFIQRIPCKWFLIFCYCFTLSLKMRALKYQYGQVKHDKLGALMAPGVLKIFATLKNRLENHVITGNHLQLNNLFLRPSHPFTFLDKSTGPILPFVALALCYFCKKSLCHLLVIIFHSMKFLFSSHD